MSLYSWSFHFDKNICQQLRILKRELAKLCLSHVFDLSTSGLVIRKSRPLMVSAAIPR